MSALTATQLQALGELAKAWPGRRVALIGGSALRCHFPELFLRATDDLDLTVAVDLDGYPGALASLPGWRRGRREHQWRGPGDVKVDVVPAGPALLAEGRLVWPASGFVMNLAGLRHAFERGQPLAEAPHVLVSSRATIALLKIVSYADRPAARAHDLDDLAFLLGAYLEGDDDRRWTEEAASTAYETAPAYLLGRDLDALVNDDERRVLETFLALGLGDDDRIVARMGARSASWDGEGEDPSRRALAALRDGLRSAR